MKNKAITKLERPVLAGLALFLSGYILFTSPRERASSRGQQEEKVENVTSSVSLDPASSSPKSPKTKAFKKIEDSPPAEYRVNNVRNEDPQVAKAQAVSMKRKITSDYALFVGELGLSLGDRTKLLELLTSRAFAERDVKIALAAYGITDPEDRTKQITGATKSDDEEIAQLLGAEKSAQLNRMLDAERQYRDVKNTVALDMIYAGAPLTDQQSVALALAMRDIGYRLSPTPPNQIFKALGEEPVRIARSSIDKLVKATAGVLSPAQIEILKSTHAAKLAQEGIMDRGLTSAAKQLVREIK